MDTISFLLWAIFYFGLAHIFYFLYIQIRLIWIFRKFPTPPLKPILGHVLDVAVSPDKLFKFLRKQSREYYPFYLLWVIHWPAVNVMTPEDIEIFLSSTNHTDKSVLYEILTPWLNEGLLTSNGKKWHKRRKILTPAFHFNILQQFVITFVKHAENLVETLKKECDKPYTNINPYICDCTLKAICETAMGTALSEGEDQDEYRQLIYRIGNIIVHQSCRPWYGTAIRFFLKKYWELNSIARKLHSFTKKFIKQREANFKASDIPRDEEEYSSRKKKNLAMLDLLLLVKSESKGIDDNGILEEVDTFTFEGHDTTATNIIFTLLLLANNKDVQDKVVEELREVFGDGLIKPTYHTLQNLPYLENCLKESLRLYPSVPFISRKTSKDIVTATGYWIPKDTLVNIHIYDLHHDPSLYPDPEKFDPGRFLPENVAGRHPYAYIPFSAGPRNCIGQKFASLEVKTILAYILSEFELLPVDTPKSIIFVSDLVLRTKYGVKIKLIPRKKN